MEHTLLRLRLPATEPLRLPFLHTLNTLQLPPESPEHISIQALVNTKVLGPAAKTLVSKLEQAQVLFGQLRAIDVCLVRLAVVVLVDGDTVFLEDRGGGVFVVIVLLAVVALPTDQPAEDVFVHKDGFLVVVCCDRRAALVLLGALLVLLSGACVELG